MTNLAATAEPQQTYTLEEVGRVIAAMAEAKRLAVEAAISKERETAKRVLEASLDDQRRELFAGADANYKHGRFTLARLKADSYRDVSAVLAECRSRLFAGRLDYSDPDGEYTVTALVGHNSDWPPRKLVKSFTSSKEAWDFYSRILDKFYVVENFTTCVDY